MTETKRIPARGCVPRTISKTEKAFRANPLRILLLLFMIAAAGFWRPVQAGPTDIYCGFIKNDLNHFLTTGKQLAVAPYHFTARDWQKIGGLLVITGAVSLLDRDIRRAALSNQSDLGSRLFYIDHWHGNQYSFLYGLGSYSLGLALGKERIRGMGLHAMESFIYAGFISTAIKIAVGRRRPYGGDSQYVFKPFRNTTEFRSLPSGHTVIAFAVSTAFAKSLPNTVWRVFWYGSAAWVAAARIYHNAHWASDVVPSAVLGYSVASWIVRRPLKQATAGKMRIRPALSVSEGIYQYHLVFSW